MSANQKDLWCSCSEFLDLGSGDWEEHAILLANYYLSFDQQQKHNWQNRCRWNTYVVLGTAVPEGTTAYVLRRKVSETIDGIIRVEQVILYNAVTGNKYHFPENTGHPICPLEDIGVIFDYSQIWANVQPAIKPTDPQFSYQLENPNLWRPLFNRKYPQENYLYPFGSIQKPILNYFSVEPEYYRKRAKKIVLLIQRSFDSWRGRLPTQ
eukprot:UN32912